MEIILVIVFIVFIGIIVWRYNSLPDDLTEEEKAIIKTKDDEEKDKIKAKDEEGEDKFQINYYYMLLFSCGFFGVIFFYQSGVRGDYTPIVILDFFISFLAGGFLPMVLVSLICFPIKIFSKINFGKLLFWTSIIFGTLNLLNGTITKI